MLRQHPEEIIQEGDRQILIMPDGRKELLVDGQIREEWVRWEILEVHGKEIFDLFDYVDAGHMTRQDAYVVIEAMERAVEARADELFGPRLCD